MTLEDKAKAYDEAKEIIKGNLDALNEITETGAEVVNIQSIKNCFYRAFPELQGSEDGKNKRISKEITQFLKQNNGWNREWLAWLEKQGERKELSQSKVTKKSDQEWSEECDENLMMIEDRFSDYLDYIREDSSLTKHRKNTLKEEIIGYVNWLKTFKERLS